MELRLDPCLVLLLLEIVLANVPQIVAREQVSCNETQYLEEDLNRCCSRCPPGQFREKKCTQSSETKCQACGAKTYAAQWNYAPSCRRCSDCSKNLVETQPCNATQAAVCGCPDGYICDQRDALNRCMFCTEAPVSEPEELPPDMKNTWIIVGVVLFIVTSFVVIVCLKARLLKRFGRMIKNKSCSESTPQPETGVDMAVVGAVNGYPTTPLMKSGPITTPSENLRYPVPVSDATDIGEFALLTG